MIGKSMVGLLASVGLTIGGALAGGATLRMSSGGEVGGGGGGGGGGGRYDGGPPRVAARHISPRRLTRTTRTKMQSKRLFGSLASGPRTEGSGGVEGVVMYRRRRWRMEFVVVAGRWSCGSGSDVADASRASTRRRGHRMRRARHLRGSPCGRARRGRRGAKKCAFFFASPKRISIT